MHTYKIFQLVLILTPFVFSFAFGLDIYIPIVPQMSEIFDTSPAMIQLTLSLFLFTTGFGQLFIGPLSDQWGRKKIFYIASAFYAIGSLGCAFSPDIFWLITSRLISSLGACGMLVTSFAVVRDLFSSHQSAKMYSFLNGAIGISPTFAPILGGYLGTFLGWQSIFLFLGGLGLFSLIVTNFFIYETHPEEKRILLNRMVFNRYLEIIQNRQFIIYSVIAGFAEGVFFCFFSISPFIIIDLLKIPTYEFGYYFAIFGSVIGLGGFASGKMIEKNGIQSTISCGISLMFLGGFSMLAWHYIDDLSLQGFLIPMVFACTGAIFLVGGCASAALEPFASIAGTASAAFGAIEFGLSACIGSILMMFTITSTIPYGISILLMALFSLILFLMSKKKHPFKMVIGFKKIFPHKNEVR